MTEITAVVLAGGFGTRIRHLLGDLPKPMAPVLGRPFLEWVVRHLAGQGIRKVILSTGYRAEIVEEHFRGQPVENVDTSCVPETEPLGTAGGFLNAVRTQGQAPQAWLVSNGDSLVFADLAPLVGALDDPGISGAILGLRMADASRYGTIIQDAAGHLVEFAEKKTGVGVINAGVYLFRATLLDAFPGRSPLSFEKDVFPDWIRRGVRLQVCATDAPFLDIGTPESLPQAEAFIRQNRDRFGPAEAA